MRGNDICRGVLLCLLRLLRLHGNQTHDRLRGESGNHDRRTSMVGAGQSPMEERPRSCSKGKFDDRTDTIPTCTRSRLRSYILSLCNAVFGHRQLEQCHCLLRIRRSLFLVGTCCAAFQRPDGRESRLSMYMLDRREPRILRDGIFFYRQDQNIQRNDQPQIW